ncbi:MAG: SpoIIE family protein phosphatase [Rhodospirillaceae bacterium]|jgi:phosphoserine phosphatase RsbU/P|nr:SpoIIE family protein phosphatase [Rhodospirillaceae bacterium]MBT5373599.1 SpoIIE family protein phosphatase [Rhodospirillaceae bacterium]MBT5658861.1 SpoIIE family protein phosphatase [Rhodospirillaceae bacterium]MBT5751650.1 SpoIIE family protein phosphatase [Rhodospirillaceae bacterium]
MESNSAYDLGAPRSGGEYRDTLELLAEMARDFSTSLDIHQTLGKALVRITHYLGAEAASLFLLENDDTELVCITCEGPVDIGGLRIASDHGIVGRSVQDNLCQIIRDVSQDPDFKSQVDEKTGFTTRSILCAPMSVKDSPFGAIEVINKKGGDGLFDENDRHILQALACSAALALLNARMALELVEKERLRHELDLAAEIQRGLLPQRQPAPYPVAGINLPARGVSGDLYDFFTLEDGRIFFCLGDVSGKGMNASLLMAKTSSLYRCLGRTNPEPGALLAVINNEIFETATHGMFVTMVGGLYDRESGKLIMANAGHEPPLYIDADGNVTSYEAEEPPLGIMPGTEFPEVEINLKGGELYIFTDGVTESPIDGGKMLGATGFTEMIKELKNLSLADRLDMIVDRVAGDRKKLHDDITILGIEHRAPAE